MLKDFVDEFLRYKLSGQKAIEQVSNEGLNQIVGQDLNSIAMLIRHISGNLLSRFADFLTSDGEKSWRHREAEFESREYARTEIFDHWDQNQIRKGSAGKHDPGDTRPDNVADAKLRRIVFKRE